ncbi:MAG: hypothetical protein J6X27_06465 [Bacteroidaceae bacterium]|nr:hypothetical protein [Bacteroidaceae bacterium]
MKKTILFLLVAALSVASVHAQETKKAIYVIDGTQVENFDGSQLNGKTIVNYSIDPKHNLHSIITTDMTGGKEVKSVTVLSTTKVGTSDEATPGVTTDVIRTQPDELVTVVDGKIVSSSEFQSLSSSEIESMTVIKDKENPIFKKIADEYMKTSKHAPACVIIIETKK